MGTLSFPQFEGLDPLLASKAKLFELKFTRTILSCYSLIEIDRLVSINLRCARENHVNEQSERALLVYQAKDQEAEGVVRWNFKC